MAETEFPLDVASDALVQWLGERYKGWEGAKQFGDTPQRLERMFQEFCWTQRQIDKELDRAFKKVFKNPFNEMLVVKEMDVWTLCPHHLLPCHFSVTIGYVPNGDVLGLSKFSRIAEILAKRPVMQEEYSTELADMLMKRLEPKGVAVQVVGEHGCMSARGIKQHSEVITSTIRGVFEKEPETRAEFLAICRS